MFTAASVSSASVSVARSVQRPWWASTAAGRQPQHWSGSWLKSATPAWRWPAAVLDAAHVRLLLSRSDPDRSGFWLRCSSWCWRQLGRQHLSLQSWSSPFQGSSTPSLRRPSTSCSAVQRTVLGRRCNQLSQARSFSPRFHSWSTSLNPLWSAIQPALVLPAVASRRLSGCSPSRCTAARQR